MTRESAKAGFDRRLPVRRFVRYRLDAPPTDANLCHCRMCQKAGGTPMLAFANLPADKFVLTTGKLGTFVSSAIAERGFCAACGTPLTYRGLGSARISVTTGSLDDPNAVPPQMQLGVESRACTGWTLRWRRRRCAPKSGSQARTSPTPARASIPIGSPSAMTALLASRRQTHLSRTKLAHAFSRTRR